jgi:prepilin-type N-terminal cleavage/methylation domain-containing protein
MRRAFTLIELLVVIVIIGIILSFVLVAAMDAARRAEERATQSLITKLEGGLSDRLDALMSVRPDPNYAHAYMAAVWNSNWGTSPSLTFLNGTTPIFNTGIKSTERAQVFAWYDYLKRELPDVFFLQTDQNYPINFAGQAYPGGANPLMTPNGSYASFVLPLGNTIINGPLSGNASGPYGDGNTTSPGLGFTGAGIYGASYPIAAGVYKNLGYSANGYDGVDNNSNNLIDEIGEGGGTVTALRTNHTHATARSEMLYAILVEGMGPWGTVFSRDEFTDREVQDTDGDGLPEFVDAWGQPLQFFRWPVLYHSDLQRGQVILPDPTTANQWDLLGPYQRFNSATGSVNLQGGSVFQERERDALDPNQQLTSPQWWSQAGVGGQVAANNASPIAQNGWSPAGTLNPAASGGVQAFEYFFHRLTEPMPSAAGGAANFWDRGGSFARRAFYSKFLILSGGRDKQPGVFLYADSDMQAMGNNAASFLIANENNAMPFALDLIGPSGFQNAVHYQNTTFSNVSSFDPTHPSSYDLQQSAQDDISNHNLQAVSGIGGSG